MAAVNRRQVLIGAAVAGVVWNAWSLFIDIFILGQRYTAAQQADQFLSQPRYPAFVVQWIVMLFLLSAICSCLYASVRATMGPGPLTALKLGAVLGFLAGFPVNFALATWMPLDRVFPLWWMLELWVGAILATLVAGWFYKD